MCLDQPGEALAGDVRVHLSGLNALMPEQELDRADVGAAVDEMGREAVPERVRRHPNEAGEAAGVGDDAPDAHAGDVSGSAARA